MTSDQSNRPSAEPPSGLGRMLADVTNRVVQLHSEYYGKGPTRSKSYLLDDMIVCVMRDALTTVERTLVRAGREEQVRQTRLVFQQAMRDEFMRAVEEASGRRVVSVLSQISFEPELAVDIFMLEPEPPS